MMQNLMRAVLPLKTIVETQKYIFVIFAISFAEQS
jgi:hypothetical protein